MARASKTTPKAPSTPSAAPATPAQNDNKPVHTIRYRAIKVAIWENHGQTGTFYSITATRSYQDEQKQWHDSTSFPAGELPTLAKAITDAHSWIAWQERRNKDAAKAKGGGG